MFIEHTDLLSCAHPPRRQRALSPKLSWSTQVNRLFIAYCRGILPLLPGMFSGSTASDWWTSSTAAGKGPASRSCFHRDRREGSIAQVRGSDSRGRCTQLRFFSAQLRNNSEFEMRTLLCKLALRGLLLPIKYGAAAAHLPTLTAALLTNSEWRNFSVLTVKIPVCGCVWIVAC